jgi:hypothetical protein
MRAGKYMCGKVFNKERIARELGDVAEETTHPVISLKSNKQPKRTS